VDRRILAKVDRRLLSEMDHEARTQLVKVPVSDAVWSTWRRYCDAVGVSMGRGLAVLLHYELASVIDEDLDSLSDILRARQTEIAVREAEQAASEAALTDRGRTLMVQERDLADRTRRLDDLKQDLGFQTAGH